MKSGNRMAQIFQIAVPVVIQGMVFQIQLLTDKAFLGKMDAKYISALGAAQFPYNTTMDTVVALGTGLVIYTAQLIGAKKKKEVSHYVVSSIIYGSVLSALLFLFWFFCTEGILQCLNVDTAIIKESARYLRICSGSILILGIDSALQSMLQGVGDTRPIMTAGILKVSLNVILSYLLIFGKFGLPKMNIEGAAIGTLAANLLSSMLLMGYCFFCRKEQFCLNEDIKIGARFHYYKEVVLLGLPTAMEYFLWNASNLVLIAFLNSMNYEATAIYTLTFGIEVVIYAVFNGTGKAVMTLIGQKIGAREEQEAKNYLKLGIRLNVITVAVAGILFTIFGRSILRIFTNSSSLIEKASFFLILTAVIMLPKSMNVIIGNSIRAFKDTKWMLCSQIIGSTFVVTFSFLLVKVFHLGIISIYLTLFSDELIRSILNALHYKKKYSVSAQRVRQRKNGKYYEKPLDREILRE